MCYPDKKLCIFLLLLTLFTSWFILFLFTLEKTALILKENGCGIDPYEYWLWDGIHPTEAMHSLLAELWLEAVADIL